MGRRSPLDAGVWTTAMNADFKDLVDLASDRLGALAVGASDEFFGPKERLLRPEPPVWEEHEYTDRGKWMDGWETRRRRDVVPGDPEFNSAHDWCIVRLGSRGHVRGIDVDTAHFKGNFPESCAVDVCVMPGTPPADALVGASWQEVVPRSPLRGDSHNLFQVQGEVQGGHASHVRLRIFPDGGVARLRVYGEVVPDWDVLRRQGAVDLAALLHGGHVVACSDMFFGSRHNLIMPGEARGMADGWETKRRRTPGHDWTIVRLGAPGTIARVDVDTRHFKGNAPGACSLDACTLPLAQRGPVWDPAATPHWRELLPRTPLESDRQHTFDVALKPVAAVTNITNITHVRFNIFPDGGVARLRLFGRPA
jgi:allantoicase